jgi:two-component system, NarL family, response regulator DevR
VDEYRPDFSREADSRTPREGGFHHPRPAVLAARLTAVISDPQPVVREGLRSWLRAGGLDVVAEVGKTAEAVAEAKRLCPEILILGASASDPAVAEACAAIGDLSPETATVVLAQAVDDDEVLRAALSGARAYLLKDSIDAGLPAMLRRIAAGEQIVDAAAAAALFRVRGQSARSRLTDQELKIVRLAAEGCTNPQIGERLYLSRHTVKEYLSNAMRKLEVDSRVEAAVEADRRGLLGPTLPTKAA